MILVEQNKKLKINKIRASSNSSALISEEGTLYLFGEGIYGEFLFPQKLLNF